MHDAAHEIDRDRKANSFRAAVAAVQHGGVDADQLAVRVDQCTPGIARIDRGIRLDEILKGCEAKLASPGGAHDALCHGLAQPVRIADRKHDISDPQRVGASDGHHRYLADVHIENGNIRIRVLSDNLGVGNPAIAKLHFDRVSAGNHVLIGDDAALIIDDDAGAQAALDALPVAWPIIAEQLIERGHPGFLGDQPRRIDIDDRRGGARDCISCG